MNENICDSSQETKFSVNNCKDASYAVPLNSHHCRHAMVHRKKVQVVLNMAQDMQQSSFDDTSWSEDAFESESSMPVTQVTTSHIVNQLPQCGSRDISTPLFSHTRAVGVAHPIKQSCAKLSQVVKPTFLQQPPSRLYRNATNSPNSNAENEAQPSNATFSDHNRPLDSLNCSFVKPSADTDYAFETNGSISHEAAPFSQQTTTSFSPNQQLHANQSVRKIIEDFFPPPPCLTTSTSETIKTFSKANTTAVLSKLSERVSQVQSDEKITLLKFGLHKNETSEVLSYPKHSIVVPSVSAESASSGFISSSPHTSFTIHPSSNEKLRAIFQESEQTKPESIKRKLVTENIYDEVFEEFPELEDHDSYQSISETTSAFQDDQNSEYPCPEYVCESDEAEKDYEKNPMKKKPPGEKSTRQKPKKSRKFPFSKKLKKSKKTVKEPQNQNEETFFSPSYDEDPVVPIVEGWQEIEYDTVTYFSRNDEAIRSMDDSCITSHAKINQQKEQGFFTMRPKNHQRQQLPKLRTVDREWNVGNNPMFVSSTAPKKI